MADTHSITPDSTARFFDNYLKCTDKASMPEKQRLWHVKRVEEFINAQNEREIKIL